jgi:hypothetical protein
LSREDLIQLEGVVKKMLGGGTMEVDCDQGLTITGVLSGRMKKNKLPGTETIDCLELKSLLERPGIISCGRP